MQHQSKIATKLYCQPVVKSTIKIKNKLKQLNNRFPNIYITYFFLHSTIKTMANVIYCGFSTQVQVQVQAEASLKKDTIEIKEGKEGKYL